MASALGLCFRGDELSEADAASFAHEIDIYKSLRTTISSGVGLTPHRAGRGGERAGVGRASGKLVRHRANAPICAFQEDMSVDRDPW